MSKLMLVLFSTSAILGSTLTVAAVMDTQSTVIAREASEPPRGADNEKAGDRQHRGGKAIEQFDILAREASEPPRGKDNEKPGDRQHRGGRHTVATDEFVIAREAGERPRGEGKGHPHSEEAGNMILAREGGSQNRGRRGV